MSYNAVLIADSVNIYTGIRCTTFELSLPKYLVAEFNTHRMLCLDGDSVLEFDLPGGQDKDYKRVYRMTLENFVTKWNSPKFGIRYRLKHMNIRQLDEITGKIVTSTVKNCFISGIKEVFTVKAGDYSVTGSADHLLMTDTGYVRIADMVVGKTAIVVRAFGKLQEDRTDPYALKFVDGRWRSVWQRENVGTECESCSSTIELQVHHVIPVHVDPTKAYDLDNVVTLCKTCHQEQHVVQDTYKRGGTYLYGDLVKVDSITSVGVRPTYDLEIAGQFPNFLANGVVVHNSRNSASSRAIPTSRLIKQVQDDCCIPLDFRAKNTGMEAHEQLTEEQQAEAREIWISASKSMVEHAERLMNIGPGVDKQRVNRLLEPFMWTTIVATATEWENYFALRVSKQAQPELFKVSSIMYDQWLGCEPFPLIEGQWHLPYLDYNDIGLTTFQRAMRSAARCGRVSYLRHNNTYQTIDEDVARAQQFIDDRHMSPLEHPSMCVNTNEFFGHSQGFKPLRKFIRGESGSFTHGNWDDSYTALKNG